MRIKKKTLYSQSLVSIGMWSTFGTLSIYNHCVTYMGQRTQVTKTLGSYKLTHKTCKKKKTQQPSQYF